MPARRPKPLTAAELKLVKEQWGDDRVVRKLLWEISRLRNVVHRWYTYHWTVRHYRNQAETHAKDLNEAYIHEQFLDLFEGEPVLREREKRTPYEPSKRRRWPHMSEDKESALVAKIEAGDDQAAREAKRHTREAR